MIISASRRTDLPAFFGDWLCERFREGVVEVRNPRNPRQARRLELSDATVDGVVFWSKNPQPLFVRHRGELEALTMPFYFQFTITPYDDVLEPGVPPTATALATFMAMARAFGRERMVWRYDPIVLTPEMDGAWHCRHFAHMAQLLAPHTDTCIVSFLDFYPKARRRLRGIPVAEPGPEPQYELLSALSGIASAAGLTLATCTENHLGGIPGVATACCIDAARLGRIGGKILHIPKDRNQRPGCGCAASVDIGAYNTCSHDCKYCYANA